MHCIYPRSLLCVFYLPAKQNWTQLKNRWLDNIFCCPETEIPFWQNFVTSCTENCQIFGAASGENFVRTEFPFRCIPCSSDKVLWFNRLILYIIALIGRPHNLRLSQDSSCLLACMFARAVTPEILQLQWSQIMRCHHWSFETEIHWNFYGFFFHEPLDELLNKQSICCDLRLHYHLRSCDVIVILHLESISI